MKLNNELTKIPHWQYTDDLIRKFCLLYKLKIVTRHSQDSYGQPLDSLLFEVPKGVLKLAE